MNYNLQSIFCDRRQKEGFILRKIGILELNTTDVRMIFADVCDNQSFICTEKVSESIKIASELSSTELISQQSISNLINILKTYKSLCTASQVSEIYAVASYEYQTAKNQRSFFEELFSSSGFRFRIMSQDEQLNNLYLSFINSLDVPKGLILSLDGTNIQVLAYNRRNISEKENVPVSVLNLVDKNIQNKTSTKVFMQDLTQELMSKFGKIEWLNNIDSEIQIVGTGEGFTSLAKLSQKLRHYTFNRVHGYTMTKQDLDKVYEFLCSLEIDSTKKMKGISNERADIVAGYICAIKALIETVNVENIVISENGVAEGVLFGKACPLTLEKPIGDVLGYSLDCLNDCYNQSNIKNTKNVYELSLILFKQLKVLHKLPRTFIKVLRTASYMHDCGKRISSIDFEKKGFSVILNSDLYGLSHREQILSAFVVASQNLDNFSTTDWVKYKDLFTEQDLEGVRKLAVIVRLANALDYCGAGKIKDINCDILGDSVIMKTVVESPADAEIAEGLKVSNDFVKAFKKHLEIL